jgi:hypothetical protein
VESGPLKTATEVVGLLAGAVAAMYVLGGVVVALRLLFEGFTASTVVAVLGQLPREVIVSTALLEVLGPAAVVGVVATLAYGARNRPLPRQGGDDRLDRGPHPERTILLLIFISIALTIPSVLTAIDSNGFSPLLLTSFLGLCVTFGTAAAGWFLIRRTGRKAWYRLTRALAAGAIWAGMAVTPAVMLASAVKFADAQVCTSDSPVPQTGALIGETGDHVLLATDFGSEESILSLPADHVTKNEYGDLEFNFVCPAPPGSAAEAPAAAAAALGGHGGQVERGLAVSLRPYLQFDSAERWRPLNVGLFISERFSDGHGHGVCPRGSEPPCPDGVALSQLDQRAAYLDIHGQQPNGADFESPPSTCARPPPSVDCNGGRRSVIYYRRTTHEGRWYWDYWWLMRYNDYIGSVNNCRIICGDHEGDWEGMTVVTTPSLEPKVLGAIYASHRDRIWVDGSILPLAGNHALAFVADGTHASYPFTCEDGCKQYSTRLGRRLPEEDHDGAVDWGGNDEAACQLVSCVIPLPEVGDPDDTALPVAGLWAGWDGHWGETCHNGCRGFNQFHEGSPASPGLQTRFRCPWVPTRRAILTAGDSALSKSGAVGDTLRQLAACRAQRGDQ